MASNDLIFDWNTAAQHLGWRPVELFDETLRDGLQTPSISDPSLPDKLELVRLMDRLGIDAADIGLPGAGRRAYDDTLAICRMIATEKLRLRPACAARTVIKDLEPIVDIVQATGLAVEVYPFIGSSPIRFFAEDWTIDGVRAHIHEAVTFTTRAGLQTCLVTEDTTRTPPDKLRPLLLAALEAGATALCLCDTAGHATPNGVRALVAFAKELIREAGRPDTRLDWHGHNDRGLGVINALTAIEAGCQRIHGSALGVGERVGNPAIEQLIVNLKLDGAYPHDIAALAEYSALAAKSLGIDIAINQPIIGRDAFRTGTGVHAAAIIKAIRKGDRWLADRVYSSVPATELGRAQEIDVGPMSGLSNVVFWLEAHEVRYSDALAQKIFQRAKASSRLLTEDEIWSLIRAEA